MPDTAVDTEVQETITPSATSETQPTPDATQDGESSKDTADQFTDESFDPKAVEKWTPQELEKRYKSFQGDYTRKTKALADKAKTFEDEKKTYLSQTAEMQRVLADVLTDPEKAKSYRQVYGPRLGIQEKKQLQDEVLPRLETVDDLHAYIRDRDGRMREEIRQEFRQALAAERYTMTSEQRWNEAIREVAAKNPFFSSAEVQDLVVKLVSDEKRPYVSKYRSKELTEAQVIEQGIEELKTLLKPELEKAKAQATAVTEKKKKSVTEMPAKGAVPTEPSRKLTREEIISRVRQTIGS